MKTFICPYCNKEITVEKSQNIANHKRWCKCNPKRKIYEQHLKNLHESFRGKKAWNNGLTTETCESIRSGRQKIHERYKSGQLIHPFKGKHHTEKTKKKMSESALKSEHQRICKETLPYICVDGTIVNLDSSYERKLAKILDDNFIKWIRPKPLKWFSFDGKQHNYFPDFYLIDYDLYLDPKNEYCFRVQTEKIKYISEHYSNVYFLHEQNLSKEFIMSLCHKGCGADF